MDEDNKPWNVRRARQEFSEMVNLAESGHRLQIERMGRGIAGVVSVEALQFLDSLERASSPDDLLAVLSQRQSADKYFVRQALVKTLQISLRERRKAGGKTCIMELPYAEATEKAGRVSAVEFGGDGVILDAHIYLTGGSDSDQMFLRGSIELAVDKVIGLELSNGQVIGPELMVIEGMSRTLRRIPVEGAVELEFTTIRYADGN